MSAMGVPEQATPKSSRLKIVMVILAVLLVISAGGLAARYVYLHFFAPAQSTVTVPDNLIGEENSESQKKPAENSSQSEIIPLTDGESVSGSLSDKKKRGSYDFAQQRRFHGGALIGKIPDDVLAGHDADKAVGIIHHGNEVLVHGTVEQFFHGDGDADRGIVVSPQNVPDLQLFQRFHGAERLRFRAFIQKAPEEVTFTDSPNVPPVPGDDRDGSVAVMVHFFQALTEGTVVVEIGNAALGDQKISNVHDFASFLRGRQAPGWLLRVSDSIIEEHPGKVVNNL